MDEQREIVIGHELAAARDAERERLTGDPPPSPLPAGRYQAVRGDFGLLHIAPNDLDAELRAFIREYRSVTIDHRSELRNGVSIDDAYTLLTFARRSSVFALRGDARTIVDDGLGACAAIGYDRIDRRDGLVALALLYHAAARCEVASEEVFAASIPLGEPGFARLVEGFLARPARGRDLRAAWGYTEADGPRGIGLLRAGYEPWSPSTDLTAASLRVAAALRADEYVVDDPELAAKLPSVWLSKTGDLELEPILGRVRGAAVIHGHLQEGVLPEPHTQQLSAWVVEALDDRDAGYLERLARSPRPGDALLGVTVGAVFALVVGRSVVVGVPSHENTERLSRFKGRLQSALEGRALPATR